MHPILIIFTCIIAFSSLKCFLSERETVTSENKGRSLQRAGKESQEDQQEVQQNRKSSRIN